MLSRSQTLQTSSRFFSSAQAQAVKAPPALKTDSTKIIDAQKKYIPMQLVSEFGDLLNLKPMTKLVKMQSEASG